jgi:hypothetical protein
MTIPPPWLAGDSQGVTEQPAAQPAPGRWVKGMPSPNKAGRPRGIVDKRSKLAQRMLADADGIVSALIDKALEGDTGAAGLILGRVLPSLRSQAEKVQFDFDATAPVATQIEQVLDAMAAGVVAPDVGRQIIDAIGTLSNARAVEELEGRIITLEARQL